MDDEMYDPLEYVFSLNDMDGLGDDWLDLARETLTARLKSRASRVIDLHDLAVRILYKRKTRKPRPRGEKRHPRYEDVEGKEGMDKWRHEYEKSVYWSDYHMRLKDAEYYESRPMLHLQMRENFERAIRMPLGTYQKLRDEMMADRSIAEHEGKKPLPLPLKLMASLRFLALGCVWDGVAEIFHCSRPPLMKWFKDVFLPWMMKHKYPVHVKLPRTDKELADVVRPFQAAGFPGMCGLADGVHVWFTGFNNGVKHRFIGKERFPTVVWNVTVDYDGRPIHVSRIAAGATNDKQMADEHDRFLNDIIHRPLFADFEYELMTENGTLSTKGAYLGVDNGYQDLRIFIPPYKNQRCGVWSYTWSKWHESLRKKVECFFGRLKKKYRCLATEVKMTDMMDVDRMFKVCCCLDVMVRNDRGDFDNDELDWRQLDDDEISKAFGERGSGWLARYRREEWHEELQPVTGLEIPAEDNVDVPAPAPFEELGSGRALRDALIHHFKRFKTQMRASRPPQHAPLRRLNIN